MISRSFMNCSPIKQSLLYSLIINAFNDFVLKHLNFFLVIFLVYFYPNNSLKFRDSTLFSSSFSELPIRKSFTYLSFFICFSYNFLFKTHIIYFNFFISLFFRDTVINWSAFMHFYRRSLFCKLLIFSSFLFIY